MARQLGMVDTWPNVQTIRKAIESEARYSGVSASEAAGVITRAAQEPTTWNGYCPPSSLEMREICRLNTIDRFWFEDARWRGKFAYLEFRERLRQ